MDDDPKPPTTPQEETWTAVALREPAGHYLARGVTWRPIGAVGPFLAQTWVDEAEMRAWLANRTAQYRRDVHSGGYRPFRLTCRAGDMTGPAGAEHAEPRPLVAEAVVDHAC